MSARFEDDEAVYTAQLWSELDLPDAARTLAPGLTIPAHDAVVDGHNLLTPGPSQTGESQPLDEALERELAALPALALDDEAGADLAVIGELGQGGMGVVLRARQASLQRDVALKRLRRRQRHSHAVRALLDEARVAGSLEHPNIVPIHALGIDGQGNPTLVMKRVEGVVWRELLRDPTHPAYERIGGDRLRWHLEVLMQVCHAVELAHSRGIVHRDLKPDNVMIGDFGEIYVLDWGLAYRLDGAPPEADEPPRSTRPASRPGQLPYGVVGTPSYMAPEMLRSGRITERTDVYLLGAVLHEILTGKPRHQGANFFAMLYRIHRSDPAIFETSVSPELGAISNRATRADPAARYPSVRALREAVAEALQHGTSRELTDEALEALDDLVRQRAELGDEPHAMWQSFWECRIGFRKALQLWPENARARQGLNECLRVMIAARIEQDDEAAARGLLAELDEPAPDLSARLAALQERLAAERARVEALTTMARHRDLGVLSKSRAIQLLWMGGVAMVGTGLAIAAVRAYEFELTYGFMLPMAVLPPVVVLAVWRFWARGGVFRNEVNRQLVIAFFVMVCFAGLFRVLCWRIGVEPELSFVFELAGNTLAVSLTSILVDRRLRGPALLCGTCALSSVVWPEHSLELFAIGTFGGMMWAAAIWYRTTPEPEPDGL